MPDPAHGVELCEEAARLSEALLYCGDEQTTRAAGMLGPCRRIDEAALEPRHRWNTRGMCVSRGYVATGFVNRNRQRETWRGASRTTSTWIRPSSQPSRPQCLAAVRPQ